MAKRFTQTVIWEEDWFLDMPKEYKLFWFYIKDQCNHAGIWRPNLRIFQIMIKSRIDLKKAVEFFNTGKERIKVLVSGHWFLIDFFVFQYGNTFNPLNRVHKSIQDIYLQEGIDLTSIRGLKDLKEGVKDKDKDKDKGYSIIKGGVGGKDFIDEVIDCFAQEFLLINRVEYVITNTGKERSAAGKLLKLHKDKNPNMGSKETIESLHDYFKMCISIDDNWLRDNMSIPIIINKFNEINNKLRNGNKRSKSGSGVTDEQLARIIAEGFATDK